MGDGNINYVYIVTGPKGALCLKQGLPFVRIAQDWPLTQVSRLFCLCDQPFPLCSQYRLHSLCSQSTLPSQERKIVLVMCTTVCLPMMPTLLVTCISQSATLLRLVQSSSSPLLPCRAACSSGLLQDNDKPSRDVYNLQHPTQEWHPWPPLINPTPTTSCPHTFLPKTKKAD